jgi:transcriptional regulator with XRE-family HTH domain
MPTLAAYPQMMRRSRERLGLRECRAAWVLGLTVSQYRKLEAGEAMPTPDTYERIVTYFGWPVSYGPPG